MPFRILSKPVFIKKKQKNPHNAYKVKAHDYIKKNKQKNIFYMALKPVNSFIVNKYIQKSWKCIFQAQESFGIKNPM